MARLALYAMLLLGALILMPQSYGSSTVTLSSSCNYSSIGSGAGIVGFSLNNSGNGPATDIIITPYSFAGDSYGVAHSYSSLPPSNTIKSNFPLGGFNEPGSYGLVFLVGYTQGTTGLFASFPCLVNTTKNVTAGLLHIENIQLSSGKLELSLINLYSTPVNATIYVGSPPFIRTGFISKNFTANPSAYTNLSTSISYEPIQGLTNASFSVPILVSYTYGGTHYSSITNFIYETSAHQSGTSILPYVAIVIVALLALIGLSVARMKLKKGKNQEVHQNV